MIATVAAAVVALAAHEYAHAAMADRLGDSTPRRAGRLTLAPWAHLDAFRSIVLPLVSGLASAGAIVIGAGRSVPINTYWLGPRRVVLVALAGPLANLLLAGLAWALGTSELLRVNVAFAVFNLLPLPPLDGWRVIEAVSTRGRA